MQGPIIESITLGDDDDNEDGVVAGADQPDGGRGNEAAGVIDLSGTGIANFADLALEDGDDGAVLVLGDGQTLTFRGLEAAELGGANFLFADDGEADAAVIAGSAGDDVLAGGELSDTFVFAGSDSLQGFAPANDQLDLSGAFGLPSFADLNLLDGDDGAVLALANGDTLAFDGVDVADLAAVNFIFAPDATADDADLAAAFADLDLQEPAFATGETVTFEGLAAAGLFEENFILAGDESDDLSGDSASDTVVLDDVEVPDLDDLNLLLDI
jgi:hypothetical protein